MTDIFISYKYCARSGCSISDGFDNCVISNIDNIAMGNDETYIQFLTNLAEETFKKQGKREGVVDSVTCTILYFCEMPSRRE